jgi:tRNA threonylcarbamoyl adenosine modification protein YjeE
VQIFDTQNPRETFLLGRKLAVGVRDGSCIALVGDLGAGKTALVRGLADGMGADVQMVSSPTYVLVQEYPARDTTLFHLDLYRMVDVREELDELGMDEMLAQGVVVVEWADRASGALPVGRTEIIIEITGENTRRFTVRTIDA